MLTIECFSSSFESFVSEVKWVIPWILGFRFIITQVMQFTVYRDLEFVKENNSSSEWSPWLDSSTLSCLREKATKLVDNDFAGYAHLSQSRRSRH